MEADWVESYYEAVEFFYWEPQHLGKRKHANAELDSVSSVRKRLRNMEVTLNQNLHQFFLLAPDLLRNELFAQLFGKPLQGQLSLHGRDVDEEFKLQNSVQPDLLFTSDAQIVSLEMKLGAKSSITQVIKYALLGLAVELKHGSQKEHFLGFLGAGSFANQWKEGFSSIAELREAIDKEDADVFLKNSNRPAHFRAHTLRFAEIVRNLSFGCLQTTPGNALFDHEPMALVN